MGSVDFMDSMYSMDSMDSMDYMDSSLILLTSGGIENASPVMVDHQTII